MTPPRTTPCIAFEGMRCIASGDLPTVVRLAKAAIDGGEHAAVLLFDSETSERIDVDFHGNLTEVLDRLRLDGPLAPQGASDDSASPAGGAAPPQTGAMTGAGSGATPSAPASATSSATSSAPSPAPEPAIPPSASSGSPRGPGRPRLGVVAREVTLLPRHWAWLSRQPGGASVALRKLVDEARRMNGGKDRRRESQEAAYRFMSALAGDLPGFEEATRALFAADAARFDDQVQGWPVDVRAHASRLAAGAFEASATA